MSNLMTRPGQTHGFTAKDHVMALEKYLGKNCLDFVIVNSQPVPKRTLAKYQGAQSQVVQDDLGKDYYKVIRADVLGKDTIGKQQGDELERSFIRHDSDKLAKVICKL